MRKLTTEEFIKRAKDEHGDRYDYSLVKYINNSTKVKIICRKHKEEFLQTPSNHLSGQGCPKCVGQNKTTEEFILEAKNKHRNKYDYSKTDYINSHTKVKIICSVHGKFEQEAISHLRGAGCPKCGVASMKKKRSSTTRDFIIKAVNEHGDRYDYSKVEYIGTHIKVKIICKQHGIFLQAPAHHLRGAGCPKCSRLELAQNRICNEEDVIASFKKIHQDRYNYSLVNYVNARTKVKIICKQHGIFLQAPAHHLQRKGCPKCAIELQIRKQSSNTKEFKKRAREVHNNKYDYSKVDYINARTKVTIICPTHGKFEQVPQEHLYGQNCPKCNASKGEDTIIRFIEKHNFCFEYQHRFEDCRNTNPLPFDFMVPGEKKPIYCLIEYDGEQHFEPVQFGGMSLQEAKANLKRTKENDEIKTDYCTANGIDLVRISYQDFDNIEDILKKKLLIT